MLFVKRSRVICAVVVLAALGGATAVAGSRPAVAAGKLPVPKITAAQLRQMVLPRELLAGGRFDVLPKSWSSGPLTSGDAPRYTLDPRDTGRDLAANGWVAGYDQSWGPGFAPDGVFFGGTTVQLFRDEATAALHHARQIESFRSFRGRAIEGGWTLESTARWQVPSLGPAVYGIRNVFKSQAGMFYDTEIHLRLGRVLGEIGIVSSRNTDLRRAIESDGRTLLLRMRRVSGAG